MDFKMSESQQFEYAPSDRMYAAHDPHADTAYDSADYTSSTYPSG